ncbi:hypothetical protein AX14_000864 [Amanita brunnescens Koide BX004]|nr:hypothetical protein AX14_000864 [Amanita brunnescens Koide BX004]
MDPGPSRSPIVQRQNDSEAVAFVPQPGQPTHGYFAHAHNFEIHGSQFYDILIIPARQKFISEHAFYDSKARFPPPRCYPETRVEVLERITEWIDDSDPHERIFWLNGPAGAGKSAIIQTIAERCKDTQLAASFFFKRNTPDRGVADYLFLTLAWQLAMSIPELRPYLESTPKAEHSIHAKSIDVQFNLLFVQVFENLFRDNPNLRLKKSLVIVDAVDECATDLDQRVILALIGAQTSKRVPLRFLVSSRPEPHIEEAFDMRIMKSVSRTLVLDKMFAPNDDIQRYLEGELYRVFSERRVPPPSSPSITDIINRLVLISSGQFIYASTVVKFVDDGDHNPEKRLNIILGTRRSTSSPYAQLDQLYIQILSQQQNIWLLRVVFVLIIGYGQSSLDFPCWVLRIKEDDLKLKLRRMHSLLHISDSGIKPYHLSLLEFLQDRKRAGKYYIPSWLVTMECASKVLDIPYAMPIMMGTIVILFGLLTVLLIGTIGRQRWAIGIGFGRIGFAMNLMGVGLCMALITIFICLAIKIRRRQKEAVIRGLLADK